MVAQCSYGHCLFYGEFCDMKLIYYGRLCEMLIEKGFYILNAVKRRSRALNKNYIVFRVYLHKGDKKMYSTSAIKCINLIVQSI